MGILDTLQMLLAPQEAEAGSFGAATSAMPRPVISIAKKKSSLAKRSKTPDINNVGADQGGPTPTGPTGPTGIASLAGMEPYFAAAQALGTPEGMKSQFQNMKDILGSVPVGPEGNRMQAGLKFSEQTLIDPRYLGAAQYLVKNAPLPGITDLRANEEELRKSLEAQRAELASKEAYFRKNPWSAINWQNVGNTILNQAPYQETTDKNKELKKSIIEFQKELASLQAKKGTLEQQQFKSMLGSPQVLSAGYVPAKSDKEKEDFSKRQKIQSNLAPIKDAKELYDDLADYKDKIAKYSFFPEVKTLGVGGGPTNQDLNSQYNRILDTVKNREKMGQALNNAERDIIVSQLPKVTPGLRELSTIESKQAAIQSLMDIVKQGSDKLQSSVSAGFPEFKGFIQKSTQPYQITPSAPPPQTPQYQPSGRPSVDYSKF